MSATSFRTRKATAELPTQRLLIVDDESALTGLLQEYFEMNGYEVTCAADGMEALLLLEECPADAIITDLVMAEMDGFAFMEELGSRHNHTPVIVLTALGFQEDLLDEAMRRGASGFVSKGLPLCQLLMEVHRVLHVPEKLREAHSAKAAQAG